MAIYSVTSGALLIIFRDLGGQARSFGDLGSHAKK